MKQGELGTFVVHISHNENATWQGEIVWAERNKKQKFRSALELLKLIDSALEMGAARREAKPRSDPGEIQQDKAVDEIDQSQELRK